MSYANNYNINITCSPSEKIRIAKGVQLLLGVELLNNYFIKKRTLFEYGQTMLRQGAECLGLFIAN
jgi:hypothetical protein